MVSNKRILLIFVLCIVTVISACSSKKDDSSAVVIHQISDEQESQAESVSEEYTSSMPLTDVTVYDNEYGNDIAYEKEYKDTFGNSYSNVIRGGGNWTEESFSCRLDKEYTSLSGTFFVAPNHGEPHESSASIAFFGNGNLIYTEYLIATDDAVEFKVNLSEIDDLKVVFYASTPLTHSGAFACIADCTLGFERVDNKEPMHLSCLSDFDNECGDHIFMFQVIRDNFGNCYKDCMGLDGTRTMGSKSYRISGEYKTLKGTVFAIGDNSSSDVTFTIYGDGKELYSHTMKTIDDPKEISIDISNIKDIKVEFGSGFGRVVSCLSSCVLE